MIFVDSSAWIEFLRGTGSYVCDRVEALIARDFAVCDVVRMEVLSGARSENHLVLLRRLLARGTLLTTGPVDYETAASLYRHCRMKGETVRRLMDCLIAAVAMRQGIAVLHQDADFEALARHTNLMVEEGCTVK